MSEHDGADGTGEWVLLSYRLPREPSTPRIAIWRKLKRLGVAQLSDGLVALPADARTREQLEWIADEAMEADGAASIWLARPAALGQERELVQGMADARAAEYRAVLDEAAQVPAAGMNPLAATRRLRAELRRIGARDFFPPPERDLAHAAVQALLDPPQTDRPARAAAPRAAQPPKEPS
ncbi:Chromate resistance protein ChrB [Streptomyces antarcticus]|uniref:Chromate resistance protein ChrB n=1 Tax=Streptomyces antarcticus TaxID=2996458 RepID=UPI00226FE81D|nr:MULTISPECIES: Chromate resistance protein ChrB [unclassified Streptomyces]MCY0944773.1 chromate resistance protein [Streptomyces sp. H34-AA3]MCZ4081193.1 chromate resistance protein [Streptomyces sp. H34-S5]